MNLAIERPAYQVSTYDDFGPQFAVGKHLKYIDFLSTIYNRRIQSTVITCNLKFCTIGFVFLKIHHAYICCI